MVKGDKDIEVEEMAADNASISNAEEAPWCECNKECYKRNFLSPNLLWRTVSLGLVVLVYLLVGAGIFAALERPSEIEQNEAIEESSANYTRLLNIIANIVANQSNFNMNESIALITAAATEACNADQQPTSNWEYGSSFFFVITVVTTIGYGTIAPTTTGGRRFFIIYALVGIPIALVFLASIGEGLKTIVAWFARPVHRRWSTGWAKLILLLGYLLVGFLLYIIIPAVIFTIIQGWTMSESIYFCFVTLTTVGFGDFVPVLDDSASSAFNGLYRVCVAFWIFFGLGFLSLVIAVSQDSFESVTKKVRCKCVQSVVAVDEQSDKQSNDTIPVTPAAVKEIVDNEINELEERFLPSQEEDNNSREEKTIEDL